MFILQSKILTMHKVFSLLATGLILSFTACNNDSSNSKPKDDTATADSLQDEVVKIHDIAMPKSMKIPDVQKKVQGLLDSIGKLPAKAKEAAAPLKAKLEEVKGELSYAESAMDTWMQELNLDSAKNDIQKRIDYFTNEKMKVSKVKDAVLNSLSKADSVLKAKF